jgi:hypothetical protein
MNIHKWIRLRNELMATFPRLGEWHEHQKLLRLTYKWRKEGWPVALPHLVKCAILKNEVTRLGAEIFVETGTYVGDTLWFFRNTFRKIYSIEVEPQLAANAQHRFRKFKHVQIIKGDSAQKLGEIVDQIDGRSLFWLDGHYSSGITGRGASDCPIWAELREITRIKNAPFSIFIDDARCFGSPQEPDYPSIPELQKFALEHFPRHDFKVEHDMIMIRHPQPSN